MPLEERNARQGNLVHFPMKLDLGRAQLFGTGRLTLLRRLASFVWVSKGSFLGQGTPQMSNKWV